MKAFGEANARGKIAGTSLARAIDVKYLRRQELSPNELFACCRLKINAAVLIYCL